MKTAHEPDLSTKPAMTPPAALPDHVISIHIGVPIRRVWDEITNTGRVRLMGLFTFMMPATTKTENVDKKGW